MSLMAGWVGLMGQVALGQSKVVIPGKRQVVTVSELSGHSAIAGRAFQGRVVVFARADMTKVAERPPGEAAEILGYDPQRGYELHLDLMRGPAWLGQVGVIEVVLPGLGDKIAPVLARPATIPTHAQRPGGYVALLVDVIPGAEVWAAKQLSTLPELKSIERVGDLTLVSPEASYDDVALVASMPFVRFVEPANPPEEPLNQPGLTNHRIAPLQSLPNNRWLTGKGVTWGVGDGGYVAPHFDLEGRVINIVTGIVSGYGDHGDHCAGTVAGSGVIVEQNQGMAPRSTIITGQTSSLVNNAPSLFGTYGMVTTNNSYAFQISCPTTGTYGSYSSTSANVDAQQRANPAIIHCFAASNDGGLSPCGDRTGGFGTISSGYGNTKNAIIVGSVTSSDGLSGFSSRGPLVDGRIKPDVVAVGSSVASTVPVQTYTSKSGTSMATPGVTGSMVLLYERYKQLNAGANPDGALIKAWLMNSADDLGNPGPDFRFGYGRINILRSIRAMEANQMHTGLISTGQNLTHTITVPTGCAGLKVMVYWADRQGATNANPALVNNLDMTLTTPASVTFQPWVLNPTPGSENNAAVRGVDNLNNQEQITLSNPEAGTYTINLNGTAVPWGPQRYYVVWDLQMTSSEIVAPAPGDRLQSGTSYEVRFDAFGVSSGSWTLAYSLDNGGTWATISSSIGTATRRHVWTPPSTAATQQALLRLAHNTGAVPAVTMGPFTIMGVPTLTVNGCDRQAHLSWTAVTGATGYRLLRALNDTVELIGTTTATTYSVPGLTNGRPAYIAVQALGASGLEGRRSRAAVVTPSASTVCPVAADIGISEVISPVSGRQHTSTALTAATPVTVRVRNFGNASVDLTGALVRARLGTGPVQEIALTGTLASGALSDPITLPTPYNLAAVGIYEVEVWTVWAGDQATTNDIQKLTIRHLANPAVSLPTTLNLTGVTERAFHEGTIGLAGAPALDYVQGDAQSRLRTSAFPAVARNEASFTLDRWTPTSSGSSINHVIWTVNLSTVSSVTSLLLNFQYTHHGETASTNDRLWARGSDTQPWVQVYDLVATGLPSAGTYKNVVSLDLLPLLSGQTLTSSFQLRFGQEGNSPAVQPTTAQGFSFRNVSLSTSGSNLRANSVTLGSGGCITPGTATATLSVTNTSSSTLTNVPAWVQIEGQALRTAMIASIGAGVTQNVTFSAVPIPDQSQYRVKAWVRWDGPTPVGDFNFLDDTASLVLSGFRSISLAQTYAEGFEADGPAEADWRLTPSMDWRWQITTPLTGATGNPNQGQIRGSGDTAANGVRIMGHSRGSYDVSTVYTAQSPCFNLSSITVGDSLCVSFNQKFDLEPGFDFLRLEYSTNGATWTTVTNLAPSHNWHIAANGWDQNNIAWRSVSTRLPAAALTGTTRFRFVVVSDITITGTGVMIDDFSLTRGRSILRQPGTYGPIARTSTGSGQWLDFVQSGQLVAQIRDVAPMGTLTLSTQIVANSPVRTYMGQPYMNRDFVITSTQAPGQPVPVRLHVRTADVDALQTASPGMRGFQDVRFNRYRGINENFSLEDNSQFAHEHHFAMIPRKLAYPGGYALEFTTDGFSEYRLSYRQLQEGTTPLPVTFLSFDARRQTDGRHELVWLVEGERDVAHYQAEFSADGRLFTPLSLVKAAYNGLGGRHQYRLETAAPLPGKVYYRVRGISEDGSMDYSPIRVVTGLGDKGLAASIQLFPNPTHGRLVTLSGLPAGTLVSVHDALGREVRRPVSLPEASDRIEMHLEGLRAGMYQIRLTGSAIDPSVSRLPLVLH